MPLIYILLVAHFGIWFTIFKKPEVLVEPQTCWLEEEQKWERCPILQGSGWFILTVVFLLAYFLLVPSQNWNTRKRLAFNATQIEEQ